MKIRFRKMISILLALILVVGSLPAGSISFAADEKFYALDYHFTSWEPSIQQVTNYRIEIPGDTPTKAELKDMGFYQSYTTSFGAVKNYESYLATDGRFKFYDASSDYVRDNSLRNDYGHFGKGQNAGDWIAYKIQIPVSGTFDAKYFNFDYVRNGKGHGGIYSAYLLGDEVDLSTPELVAEALENPIATLATRILPYDNETEQKSSLTSWRDCGTVEGINLEKGEVILLLRLDELAEASNYVTAGFEGAMTPAWIQLRSSGSDGSDLSGAYMGTVGVKGTFEVGESAYAVAGVYDGRNFEFGAPRMNTKNYNSIKEGISFRSSNPKVASVDSETGLVTAHRAGKTVISAEVEAEGYTAGIIAPKEITVKSIDSKYVYDFGEAGDGRGWDTYACSENGALIHGVTKEDITFVQKEGSHLTLATTSKNEWLALRVNIPEAANYDAFIRSKVLSGYANADVYAFPAAEGELETPKERRDYINEKMETATVLGKVISRDMEVQELSDYAGAAEFKLNVPEAGDYIFVFKLSSDSGYGKRFMLTELILDGKGNTPTYNTPKETVYKIVADTAKLTSGEETEVYFTKQDGSPVSGYTVKGDAVTSEDEEIATVSGTRITAGTKTGRTKLTATLVIGGAEYRAEGYVRNVGTDMSGARISANLSAKGTSWINPNWYDLPGFYDVIGRASSEIAGAEAGKGITADYTDGVWSYYGDNANNSNYSIAITQGVYLKMNIGKDAWVAIKLNFENEGSYRTILTHAAYANSPYMDAYLIPMPEEGKLVKDYLTDEFIIGRIEGNDPNVPSISSEKAQRTACIGDAYVDEPGDYLFVFKNTGSSVGNSFFGVRDLVFSGSAVPVEERNIFSTQSLPIGKSVQLGAETVAWEVNIPVITDKATLTFESLNEDILTVTPDGIATGVSGGVANIKVHIEYEGEETDRFYEVTVGTGKTRRSYYTDEKMANVAENLSKYEWARNEVQAYADAADEVLKYGEDFIYNLVTTQELPRAQRLAARYDDDTYYTCPYCETYLYTKYGIQPYKIDAFNDPWKIACKECGRRFPSNDFGSFYELGIDEHGNWSYEQAKAENQRLIDSGFFDGQSEWRREYGYLANDLYPEKGEGWGVDDGWGYRYEVEANGTVQPRFEPFIAYYNMYGIWECGDFTGAITKALLNLSKAYLYTGDMKYGKVGAVLMDRIADVYPDLDITESGKPFPVSDGGMGGRGTEPGYGNGQSRGKALGNHHDTALAREYVLAYDALWPAFEDPEVIGYLSQKAEEMNLENPKLDADQIRRNIENNFVREINVAVRDGRINANFGTHQKAHVYAAIVLDTYPETGDWLEFVLQAGERENYYKVSGGNVLPVLMDGIFRDGQAREVAPGYNYGWGSGVLDIALAINEYDRAGDSNLLNDPRLQKMLVAMIDVSMVSNDMPKVGDSGVYGSRGFFILEKALYAAYDIYQDDPVMLDRIVKAIYRARYGNIGSIKRTIFDKNPMEIQEKVRATIEDSVEIKLPSMNLTGYGMFILRDGDWLNSRSSANNINTQRNFWMYYGWAESHAHLDKLSLGVYAYGLDFGSDFGNPTNKSGHDTHGHELNMTTVAHNTVVVNNHNQVSSGTTGKPLHFDETDKVKLMDARFPELYQGFGVEEYRRTVVMVDANDDVSYGVDFFHILGGEDHNYSFHAAGTEATLSNNVEIVSQTDENGNYIGSYQGIDKEWGASSLQSNATPAEMLAAGMESGRHIDVDFHLTEAQKAKLPWQTDGLGTYSWFGEVDKAVSPETVGTFSLDWKILDNKGNLSPANDDLGMKLTMVNSFKLDEIAVTSVIPPQNTGALPYVKNLFARHTGAADGKAKGEKLDTLFTAVVEPYDGESYISEVTPVTVTRADGKTFAMDEAKAVRVLLTNGREDYIVYAKDNTVKYNVAFASPVNGATSFAFEGFVGVLSVKNDEIVMKYLHDGTTIADKKDAVANYTGHVIDFERRNTAQNYIDVAINEPIRDINAFAGKQINVNNSRKDNGSYVITRAEEIPGGVRLYIGDITLILGYVDVYDFSRGYVYNIDVGDSMVIPMNYVEEKNRTPGDADDNGEVNSRDIIYIRRFIAGGYGVTINESAADVDANDEVNSRDIIYIRRFIAGGYGIELK